LLGGFGISGDRLITALYPVLQQGNKYRSKANEDKIKKQYPKWGSFSLELLNDGNFKK